MMQAQSSRQSHWLRSYYFTRALFSVAWIGAAVAFNGQSGTITLLLILYPLWDALANFVDGRMSGGLKANRSQALNVVVSLITAIAVAIANGKGMHMVLGVFGLWAIFTGLLQLYTGIRRWRLHGAQWVMILSGAQSTLAGGFMITQSLGTATPTILDIVPYAGFGAFYFLLSAIWLAVAAFRGKPA